MKEDEVDVLSCPFGIVGGTACRVYLNGVS